MTASSAARTGEPAVALPVLPLRRNRDFRLMWIGHATSELGTSISVLVMPLLVLTLSGSAALAGLLGTVGFATSWLATLPGGYVADMFDRRRVMLICDAGRAVLVGLTALAVFTEMAPAPALVVVVGATTCMAASFGAAEIQAVRIIVPIEQIPDAVGINQARGYAIGMVGPLMAGWLLAVNNALPLGVDAVTYLVSLVCVWSLRTTLAPENRPQVRRLLPDIGAGWTTVWRHPFMRALTTYAVVVNFAGSMLLYVLILGSGGKVLIGAGISLAAAAGLAGSLVAPAVSRRVPTRALVVGTELVRVASLVAVTLTGSAVGLVFVLAAAMLLSPIVGASLTSTKMRLVPGEILGRVNGASMFMSTALQPLAPLCAGLLVEYASRTVAQLVLVGAFGAVAVLCAVVPGFGARATANPPS